MRKNYKKPIINTYGDLKKITKKDVGGFDDNIYKEPS